MLTRQYPFALRLFTGIFLLLFLGAGLSNARAQVTVAGAVVGNGSYGTLGGAFTAINGGAQGAAIITISITANTIEPVSAVLNAGTWTSVTITPSGGFSRSISGSIIGPLISFNGADLVKIDGLNIGGNALIITNQNNSSVASTIKFLDNAQNNQVVNCTLLGASTGSATSSEGATVLFSLSVSVGTGNDNNLIATNDIGPFGASLPSQAIKSVGTAAKENSNNIINNNRIYDFFAAGNLSNTRGIMIGGNSSFFTVTSNKLYQTATRTATTSGVNLFSFIDIQSGSGYTINGNTMGFATSAGTGYTTINGGGSNIAFMIQALVVSQTTNFATAINSNVIAGIDLSSSRGTSTSGENIFIGIHFAGASSGTISVVGNTIGSGTAVNSIYVRSTAVTAASPKPVACIFNRTSAASITIDNNVIGGITLIYTGAASQDNFQLNGILNEGDGTFNITNNTIGGSVANSITSTQTGANIVGIHSTRAMVQINIQGNIIRNLTHLAQNTGTNNSSSVIGIMERIGSGNTASVITNNQIYNLSNTFATAAAQIHVKGILLNPLGGLSGSDLIEANSIHSLNVVSTAVGSSINGIHLVLNGTALIFNNMISLGNGLTGNKQIIGIRQDGMISFTHHNSIRIMGTATGTDYSACYSYRNNGYLLRTWNNIFYNERTGGANNHYALHTTALVTSYQASYNLYYTAGPAFAMYNNVAHANLAALFGATSPWNDPVNTRNLPVVFASATDLHTTDMNVRNVGFAPVSPVVTLDFDGTTRPACVDIGADEYDAALIPGTVFTWLGGISTEWCQPCNWDRETVPLATDDAIIKDDRPRYPLLQSSTCAGDEAIHDFTILPNATPAKSGSVNLGTFTLSVTGDVSIAGVCSCTGSSSLTALNTGLLDLTGATQSQSVDIRGADDSYPGTLCKLRVNKTQPTGAAGSNHEAYLRGNLIVLYNLDFANGVLISKTAGTFDANELTAVNYKTITVQSNESNAVTRQTIGAQNTRNGFFQGRLSRRIRTGPLEYLFPLGFRLSGGTGVLGNYFYTPALVSTNSVATGGQYLTATYLHDQSNPTADGVGIGFTGHGCLNAFEIDDQGGATASTCNNKEIDILSNFYWDLQETTTPAVNGDPIASPGALGAVDYDLETAGDVYALLAQDGLTGSELRLLRRPSVVIPGNAGQGPFVTTVGTHSGVNISANTGIAQYSIVAASLKGARRNGLTVFGGFASAGNGPSPLPVELLNFQAERLGDKHVLCTWETATEINNDHFEIEAARDRGGMLVFEKIGIVIGSGTTSQVHSYSFIDEHPQPGRNYYRLRQVDYDGTAGYSKMVVVQFSSGKKFDLIAASPNPFNANPVLFLQTEAGGPLLIQVENSLGQIILKKELVLSRGSSSLMLDLSAELPSGLYFVRTIFDEEQAVSRLMKQ